MNTCAVTSTLIIQVYVIKNLAHNDGDRLKHRRQCHNENTLNFYSKCVRLIPWAVFWYAVLNSTCVVPSCLKVQWTNVNRSERAYVSRRHRQPTHHNTQKHVLDIVKCVSCGHTGSIARQLGASYTNIDIRCIWKCEWRK